MARVQLSVTIITLNEELNIERCLRSVLDIADEIVVVDSHSTDRTGEICAKYPVRFIRNPFEGHIEQKNFALKQVTFDHVLSIDADEEVSALLRASIARAKENFAFDAYTFNRLNNYAGQWIRHCGWYPDRKVRLWRKSLGTWGGINPHDRVEMVTGARIGHLEGDLLHYSYRSIAHHVEKIDFLTTIAAESAFERGKKAGWLKLWMAAPFNFLRDYLVKGGFRDGFYGFVICYNAGYSKFLKYAKLRALWRENRITE